MAELLLGFRLGTLQVMTCTGFAFCSLGLMNLTGMNSIAAKTDSCGSSTVLSRLWVECRMKDALSTS